MIVSSEVTSGGRADRAYLPLAWTPQELFRDANCGGPEFGQRDAEAGDSGQQVFMRWRLWQRTHITQQIIYSHGSMRT